MVTWFSASVLAAIVLGVPLRAQSPSEYCAVEVRVRNGAGVAVETGVMVEGENGKRVVAKSVGGAARFCDFGIGKFNVVAGEPCGRVTVSGLTAAPPTTRIVNVVYDHCSDEYSPLGNACTVLLRVATQDGAPLRGAALWVHDKKYGEESDQRGRMFLMVRFDTVLQGVLRHDGHRGQSISLSCPPDKLRFERDVEMLPNAPP
jgi:hypothetical protein